MPTYEYKCQKCGHGFSEFQRIVDPPIKDCPKCGKKGCVEQIISGGSGLIFKGSGFYETDYRRKSSGGAGDAPSVPDSSKSSDTKKN
jgi:putative FmdB family regulatory protein